MTNCHACDEPLTGGSVPLVTPEGTHVQVCGTCFLKGYSAQAFEEDKPKLWARSDDDVRTHIRRIVDKDNESSSTYKL